MKEILPLGIVLYYHITCLLVVQDEKILHSLGSKIRMDISRAAVERKAESGRFSRSDGACTPKLTLNGINVSKT
jgi:hypothetical protein